MRRWAGRLLVAASILAGFAALLLDIVWWYGPFSRAYRQLNDWYHLVVYLPVASAPLLLAARLAGLDARRTLVYMAGGLSWATWFNDFFWRPALGQWDRWLGYCFRWTWEDWSYVHVGVTLHIPWWLFSLSNLLRPAAALLLLRRVLKSRAATPRIDPGANPG